MTDHTPSGLPQPQTVAEAQPTAKLLEDGTWEPLGMWSRPTDFMSMEVYSLASVARIEREAFLRGREAGRKFAALTPRAIPAEQAAPTEPTLYPNADLWDDNPDGVVPGQESGPRMNPDTGFWEGGEVDEDGDDVSPLRDVLLQCLKDSSRVFVELHRDVVQQVAAALAAHPHEAAPTEPDMRAVCEALGFDPTNHHNAAKCPYCRPAPQVPLQARVQPWLMACFGEMIAGDREERNHRFLEEAVELVQACGCTASEAHQLVDYVFGRPAGEKAQEVGGVMITLAALCLAQGLDMHEAGETELARIWTKVEQIRAKQAAKPKHSPLPEAPQAVAPDIPPGCEIARGWCVEVSAQGERVLLLSDVGYSGLADLDPWASTIRGCAEHLQAFIGPAGGSTVLAPEPESLETSEADAMEPTRCAVTGCRYALDGQGLAAKCVPGCCVAKEGGKK